MATRRTAYRTSMVSRVGLVAILLAVAGIAVSGAAARTPPTGTAMFLVEHDPRLCPSPALWRLLGRAGQRRADALRGRDSGRRAATSRAPSTANGRPYVNEHSRGRARARRDRARAEVRRPRASISSSSYAVYAPAGSGSGERRLLPRRRHRHPLHPCAVLLVSRRSRSTGRRGSRSRASTSRRRARPAGADRTGAGGAAHEGRRRTRAAASRSTAGRRPRLPGAAALPQSAAASRLSTSQASRTSSSVVRDVADREPQHVAAGEAACARGRPRPRR